MEGGRIEPPIIDHSDSLLESGMLIILSIRFGERRTLYGIRLSE